LRIVLTNLPAGQGAPMARALVSERLAACVNRFAISSIYRWEGAVCEEPEETLLIKVSEAGLGRLTERVRALHPYTVPEILVLPVDVEASSPAYVDWVRAETCPPDEEA
jgi:periplasmic divalent cation tolerance protein